jgi:hypothetical protein
MKYLVHYHEGPNRYWAGPYMTEPFAQTQLAKIRGFPNVSGAELEPVPDDARICQAEDQGGWPACARASTLQTKAEPRRYYCDFHKTNRHVWREDELEPMATVDEVSSRVD